MGALSALGGGGLSTSATSTATGRSGDVGVQQGFGGINTGSQSAMSSTMILAIVALIVVGGFFILRKH